jgi:hypothetical protein
MTLEEPALTAPMVLFLVFGALFGLATYSNRHLFSEGPTTRNDPEAEDTLRSRLTWTLVCSALWPLMALTGLYSVWLLARRRKAEAPRSQD